MNCVDFQRDLPLIIDSGGIRSRKGICDLVMSAATWSAIFATLPSRPNC